MLSISKSQWVFVDTAQQQHNLNNIVELNTKMTVETLPPPLVYCFVGEELKNETKMEALFKLITPNQLLRQPQR